jgi:hypothetical protein
MTFIQKWAWVGAVVFGLALAGGGIFMMIEARAAHNEVRDSLAAEKIVTSEDAEIPLAPVNGPAEAKAQADAIQEHVLTTTGGKTYAEMSRDDPNRAIYLQAVTLRTALMESYLAFKVADLVMGVGAIVTFLGFSQVVLGAYLGVFRKADEARTLVEARAAFAKA